MNIEKRGANSIVNIFLTINHSSIYKYFYTAFTYIKIKMKKHNKKDMIKKKLSMSFVFLMFLLFLFSILFSENVKSLERQELNYYDSIKVNISIGSKVIILPSSSDYVIDNFIANLSIFPRTSASDDQTNINKVISSSPKASISEDSSSVEYTWSKPKEKELLYSYNAEVDSRIKFPKVKEKVQFPIKQDTLPEDIKVYIKSDEFINSDDPEIVALANKIAEGSDDLYDVVFKVSKWTNDNINYSLETLTAELQQSSTWVLQNKKGVCDELTVLTIAMLRSMGIPTRFVSGSSYTNVIGDFGNHAWLESYFPQYGWLPFDPTYGQYGFVDATHIKFRSSSAAKEGAVNYAWRSKNVDIKPEKLKINVTTLEKGKKLAPLLNIKINLLKNKISGGSYVPVEIILENANDFYVPVSLHITKAPTQVFDNKIELLLKPLQTKKEYLIVNIPEDIKDGFVYTSTIEMVDYFGSKAEADVEFSKGYDIYPRNKAEEMVKSLTEEEKKIYSRDVDLDCKAPKEIYYRYENTGNLKCIIVNKGNTNLEDINVCLEDNCKKINIPISRSENIDFVFPIVNSKDLKITAENSETLKHSFVPIKVFESPNLIITEMNYPETVRYRENNKILFSLKTDAAVVNITISVDKKNVFNIQDFQDEHEFRIPFEGSYFFNKKSKIVILYKDTNGKDYYLESPININVKDVPFINRVMAKFFNIFKRS
ncbi:transglutaminase domain-containing protein [Candidatus Woesearchaeota archaeon]|nr:transglutaminase domain-containing protein [Candidatus Woesearchaeota archaeon]